MKPINNHVRIKPLPTTDFIQTQRGLYEEIGTVLDVADGVDLPLGCLVYFDSWVAKKYPVKGVVDEWDWFVDFKDIVAYELPEQPL